MYLICVSYYYSWFFISTVTEVWIWRADYIILFYIRNLSTCRLWNPWGSQNQSSADILFNRYIIYLRYSFLFFVCVSFFFLSFVVVVAISWAAPVAYGGSQARGLIRAVAAGLCQSHSNAESKPSLKSTPQLTATLDP